ncbi:MAG: hypothetical protein GXO97_05665 [Nitrospirae bacterium]|nr:hypothetical protein [Nitrospirota bacterium]
MAEGNHTEIPLKSGRGGEEDHVAILKSIQVELLDHLNPAYSCSDPDSVYIF